MTIILVNIFGLILIIAIIAWFFILKPRTVHVQQAIITITVENGVYEPAMIQVKKDTPLTLRFIRKDKNPCSEVVIFEQLNLSETLRIDKPTDINITINQSGEYAFTCQMGMYRGALIVD